MNRKTYLLLAIVALTAAGLFGCSQAPSGASGNDEVVLNLGIASAPELMQMVVAFRVIVRSEGYEPRAYQLQYQKGQLYGVLEGVPAGRMVEFIVEAVDLDGTVVYRGMTVARVVAGQTQHLNIPLYPALPMVKLWPRWHGIGPGQPDSLQIRVYNIPGLNRISFRTLPNFYFAPDSARLGPGLDAGAVFLDTVGATSTYYAVAIYNTNPTAPLVDASGYARLVTLYFNAPVPQLPPDSMIFPITALTMHDVAGNTIDPGGVYTDETHVVIDPTY